jgi:hypothetical protein
MKNASQRNSRATLIVIGLLLFSNMATALVAYWAIDRLDARYTDELNTTVPGMHETMLLAQEAANTHRAAANLLLARTPEEAIEIQERLRTARVHELERLKQVFPNGAVPQTNPQYPLWVAAHRYSELLDEFVDLIAKGDRDVAVAFRLDILRPAFDLYQARQREESIRLNYEALNTSGAISAQAKTGKSILLGFGGWPFFVMLAVMMVFAVFSVGLLRRIKRIEQDERKLRTDQGF